MIQKLTRKMLPKVEKRTGRPTRGDSVSISMAMRFTREELATYDRAAKAAGMNRSEWIRRHLAHAVGDKSALVPPIGGHPPQLVQQLAAVLYPDGPGSEWEPEMLEEVARVLAKHGYKPTPKRVERRG